MRKLFFILSVCIAIISCSNKQNEISYGIASYNYSLIDSLSKQSGMVMPEWFGAKGDGITDNAAAFENAMQYYLTHEWVTDYHIGYGYFLTSRPIIAAQAKAFNCKNYAWADQSYDLTSYLYTRYSKPIHISGSGETLLIPKYSDTSTLQQVIYISCPTPKMTGSQSGASINNSIKDLVIYGRGYCKGKVILPYKPYDSSNHEMGIFVYRCDDLKIDNVKFVGLKYGIVSNLGYFANYTNLRFENCDSGFYSTQSASASLYNCLATQCNVGYVLRSDQSTVISCNSEHSKVGMIVASSNNFIANSYIENSGNPGGEAPLIIEKGDGNTFMSFTIANRYGTGIAFYAPAKRASFYGGSIQSVSVVLKDPATNEFMVNGTQITNGANLYRNDATGIFKSLKIPSQASATGTKTPAYFDASGNLVK